MGNLRSVSKALEHLGAAVKVSSSFQEIKKADKVVLPGVGAFRDAMNELRHRSMDDPIREHISKKKPFLGICLGLQLLFEGSEENPGIKGLGVLNGVVQKFRSRNVKIPHMGWNQVQLGEPHPYLKGVNEGSYFYFVHSFYAVPADKKNTAASCTYGEETFSAIVGAENLLATQFHPEKSQEAGLQILKNFVEGS